MVRSLKLERPLACVDVESTGTKPDFDRVVELAIVTLHPDGSRDRKRWLLNPECAIPEESTAVHGLTDADVRGAPLFHDIAEEIAESLRAVDLCGFNLRAFDVPILRAEFARAGVAWPCEGARIVDAYAIFRDREPRTLSGAVRFYLSRTHDGAHRADADADATLDVLLAQVERYDLPDDLAALDAASGGRQPGWATELGQLRWRADGDLYVAFGKHAGKRLVDLDDGFLRWVLRSSFPADVSDFVRRVLRGERPRAPGAPPTTADDCDDIHF